MKKVLGYVTKEGNISPDGTFAVSNTCLTNSYKIIGIYESNACYLKDWYAEHIKKDLKVGQTYFGYDVVANVNELIEF